MSQILPVRLRQTLTLFAASAGQVWLTALLGAVLAILSFQTGPEGGPHRSPIALAL